MSTCSFAPINLFGPDPEEVPQREFSGLQQYDFVICSSSGGKDSQSALRKVVLEAERCSYPRDRIVVVHSDLGRFEWPGTKELAFEQAAHYGLRFEVVQKQGADFLERVREKFARRPDVPPWPGPGPLRWCTSDLKRGPIRKLYTRLVDEIRPQLGARKARLLSVMGMRAQESPERAKLLPFATDKDASNKTVRDVDIWLPVHHLTADEIWSDIRYSGVRYHPIYDRGFKRLSCRFCIFAPEPVLMLSGIANPELLEEYVQVERETGYSFKHKTSLIQIQQAIQNGATVTETPDWRM